MKFALALAVLIVPLAEGAGRWGLQSSHRGFTDLQFRSMECAVYLSTYALKDVWTHCCWWNMAPFLIHQMVGRKKFGWMICGWLASSGAYIAVRLGFMAAIAAAPDGVFDNIYVSAILDCGKKWLPKVPQAPNHLKAGAPVFVALGLFFPFAYARCCCWRRGMVALFLAGHSENASLIMMSAKCWIALPWLCNANILSLDGRALGHEKATRARRGGPTNNLVLMTLEGWGYVGPSLVTAPHTDDEVKVNKRFAMFVCFLYAVSELGFHVSMNVKHGNPYLTLFAMAAAYKQLSANVGGDFRGALAWLHEDMKEQNLMTPSVQGGKTVPWTLPPKDLWGHYDYPDSLATSQLKEHLSFLSFSAYQIYLIIYSYGVLLPGVPGKVIDHFFRRKDDEPWAGPRGAGKSARRLGATWAPPSRFRKLVVEAPWKKLAEMWQLRNEPVVRELTEEEFTKAWELAVKHYDYWFVQGYGKARSMICHRKFQMHNYDDAMTLTGYDAIDWGNLNDKEAELNWETTLKATADAMEKADAEEEADAAEETAPEAEAEAPADAPEAAAAYDEKTVHGEFLTACADRQRLANAASLGGAVPTGAVEAAIGAYDARIDGVLQKAAKARFGGDAAMPMEIE